MHIHATLPYPYLPHNNVQTRTILQIDILSIKVVSETTIIVTQMPQL